MAKQSLEERVPGGLAGEGASEHCGLTASAEDAPPGIPLQAVAAPSLSQREIRCLAMFAVVVFQLFLSWKISIWNNSEKVDIWHLPGLNGMVVSLFPILWGISGKLEDKGGRSRTASEPHYVTHCAGA